MDTDRLLHKCHLCKDLDKSEIETLREIGSIRRLRRGEVLFFEGDSAVGFYILLSGRVRIYKSSPEGREYTLHIIRSGQMFAEAAIFQGDTFPANCAALDESTAIFFPKEQFISLISRSPQMSLKMISALSGFVRDLNQQVENLSLKEVSARLASHLLRMSEASGQDSVILDTSKAELASQLGTISETLSRNLGHLRDRDVIRVSGNRIEIVDRQLLESIARGEKI